MRNLSLSTLRRSPPLPQYGKTEASFRSVLGHPPPERKGDVIFPKPIFDLFWTLPPQRTEICPKRREKQTPGKEPACVPGKAYEKNDKVEPDAWGALHFILGEGYERNKTMKDLKGGSNGDCKMGRED